MYAVIRAHNKLQQAQEKEIKKKSVKHQEQRYYADLWSFSKSVCN